MRRTVFTFTADRKTLSADHSSLHGISSGQAAFAEGSQYFGEADREFDLRDNIQTIVEQREGHGPFRFRNAVLAVTIFGRKGPRSRCVDPFASAWTEEFATQV